jgi:hypothetical protein
LGLIGRSFCGGQKSRELPTVSEEPADISDGRNQNDPNTWTVETIMHQRALPPQPDGTPRAVLILFVWLVPVLAFSDYSIPVDESSGRISSRPYLRVAAAPTLRFAEAPPPPDLTTHQPAGAPPKLEASAAPATEPTADRPAVAKAESISADVTVSPVKNTVQVTGEVAKPEKEKPSGPAPAPILPDDTRPRVRPEDFLPYFTFPGSSTLDAPTAPAPGRQPPSSATYRQQ